MSVDGKDSFDKIEELLMDMGTEVPAPWGLNHHEFHLTSLYERCTKKTVRKEYIR